MIELVDRFLIEVAVFVVEVDFQVLAEVDGVELEVAGGFVERFVTQLGSGGETAGEARVRGALFLVRGGRTRMLRFGRDAVRVRGAEADGEESRRGEQPHRRGSSDRKAHHLDRTL